MDFSKKSRSELFKDRAELIRVMHEIARLVYAKNFDHPACKSLADAINEIDEEIARRDK
jgi:hypothetical protein